MAKFHGPYESRAHRAGSRFESWHGAHGSTLSPVWLASGPCVRRRPGREGRKALLHQFRVPFEEISNYTLMPSFYRVLAVLAGVALFAAVVFGLCAMTADAMSTHDTQCTGAGFAAMLCESTVMRASVHLVAFEALMLVLVVLGVFAIRARAAQEYSPVSLSYEYRRIAAPLTGIRYALARGILQPKVFAAHA